MSASPWAPGPGWRQLDSAVDGITVWAPAPEADAPGGPTLTRCPQCGAVSRFTVEAGTLACEHCGWEDRDAVERVGRDGPAGEFTAEALEEGLHGFGVDRRELSCDQCGAAVAVPDGALSATCPFCASNQVNVREHAEVRGIRPGALVRFAVAPERNAALVRAWLGQGWIHPADLERAARVDRFVGMYLPWWAFSARVDARWEAEVGTPRTESYRDADGQRRTRTVIDWEWRSGRVHLDREEVRIPGTTKVSTRLLSRIADYDLDELVAYEPALLAGWQALTYDIGLPDAWERGRAAIRDRAREACRRDTGSSHVRNLSLVADLDDETWRHLLLPVYLSAFRFGGRTWVVVVNGQTGEVAGQKPVAWWKVWTAIALMLAPGLLCAVAGLVLLVVGVGAVLLVVALVLGLIGAAASFALYRHAVSSEAP